MFEVTVEQTFAAGHALRNYHGKSEDVHGHNYRVRVTVEGEQLDSTGLLVDFLEVNRLISGAAGLFFGVFHPIGGVREAIGIVIFGTFLVVCVIRAYVAIRRGNVAMHREWMIRTFAVALAISTVRVVASALDSTRAAAADPREQFVVSIWSGWLITIAAAELWIRYTRRSTDANRLALHHLQQEPGS